MRLIFAPGQRPTVSARWLASATLMLPNAALAHNPLAGSAEPATLLVALLLVLLWMTWLLGHRKIPASANSFWLFQLATIITAFTLFGPLDDLAETNTAAHMVQHMLMMVVIAPMWVMARPLPQWHAIQPTLSRFVFTPLLACVRYPMLAAALHGAVIWFWHAPRLYVLALENQWWHAVEHLCFLVTGGMFWWSVLRSQNNAAPRALLALLFTLMHTGFLGALLTFAGESLYGSNRPLAHQQLAGLLMWVMGGFPYFAAVCWVGWRWFNRLARSAPRDPA